MKIIESEWKTLERDDSKVLAFASYNHEYKYVTFDGSFNLEELEAIVEFMKAKDAPSD